MVVQRIERNVKVLLVAAEVAARFVTARRRSLRRRLLSLGSNPATISVSTFSQMAWMRADAVVPFWVSLT
jgi:hypothetical protein